MHPVTIRILLVLALAGALLALIPGGPEGNFHTEAPGPAEQETVEAGMVETTAAETQPREQRFVLTFVGDCTFGAPPFLENAGQGFIKLVGEDYGYPFRNVIDYFQEDEASFLNLEGPLTDEGYPRVKTHVFRGPTVFKNILVENSIEAVTLANNHTLDYGQTGYNATRETLDSIDVPYVETNQSRVFTTANGLTIGLFGTTYEWMEEATILEGIRDLARQDLDLVIFAPHWGNEGSYVPSVQQEALAHAAVDAGADIVWGSHPHVLQPVEHYAEGIIYYSLGNFSFGGNGAPWDMDTAILQQEVIRAEDGTIRLGEWRSIPCSVSSITQWNNFQPTPYQPGTPEYDRVVAKLEGSWHLANIKING